MAKALILVDFENEWLDKKSDYFIGDISEVLKRTNQLIDFCRKKGYKIIFTTHIEKDSDSEFRENSKNTEVISVLHKEKKDVLIKKNKISPFYKTTLEKELKGTKDIIICGILTNLCVRSLAQDAYDREFNVTIVSDCCTAFDKKTHEFTLADLKKTREEIEIKTLKKFME
jgi:nicotinamidase-related amidase